MVMLRGIVGDAELLRLYRFLTDYEIVKIAGAGSIVAVAAAMLRTKLASRPALGERMTPYTRSVTARRRTILLGVISMLTTMAMLWTHFGIPSDSGKTTVKLGIEPWVLDRIEIFLGLLIVAGALNLWFWVRVRNLGAR